MADARQAALHALEKCRRDGVWSGAAIDSTIQAEALSGREAALASRLTLGVLQNSRLCDFYIGAFCTQGAKRLEPKLRDILRLGIYQLLFLDKIPDRAAVNECVALCKSNGLARAAGLTNAVLRRVSEHKNDLPAIPGEGSAEHLAIKYSHEDWLVSRLIEEHGYAFTEEFLRCNNARPSLCVQINTLKIDAETYKHALARAEIAYDSFACPPACLELAGGNVPALPGYEDGLFYVQDRAARAAVEICAPEPGMRVLDACSAPGGKAFSAAVRMKNRGSILAWDIHEKKLARVRSAAAGLGIDILSVQQHDARQPEPSLEGRFDAVIADVPCSGLGVIRKKPEIRQKSEQEIAGLPQIQRDILCNVAQFVKPGGVLLYSTCTVLKTENEAVVKSFLESYNQYELSPFRFGSIAAAEGMYTFWPNVDKTDGFFVARMIRKR